MTGGMDRSASEIAATWDMMVLITSIKPSESLSQMRMVRDRIQ